MLEAVLVILQLKPELGKLIFDILEPLKPDITGFMNKNFTYDLSVEQLAHYTRHGLSTFKNDFSEISRYTTSRRIIKSRLEEAYSMLRNTEATPSDDY